MLFDMSSESGNILAHLKRTLLAVLTFLVFDILDTTAFYSYNPCQIGHETSIFVISIFLSRFRL